MDDPKPLSVALTFDEADALAQFVKRLSRETCRRHAASQREADMIFDAFIVVREGLAEIGFSPR